MASTLATPLPLVTDPAPALGPRQAWLTAGWAVVLWFAAATFIRHAPGATFGRGAATVVLFAVSFVLGPLTVRSTRRIARLERPQLVAASALGAGVAMMLDGIALTWTSLYGESERDLLGAAAWLLWTVGITLLAALAMERRSDQAATDQAATGASVLTRNRSGSGIT